MIEHDCDEICLYCIVTGLYYKIYKLRETNHQLAKEVLTLRKEKEEMDKQISKVKKPLDKAENAISKLKKMDKVQDKKVEKCDMKMKKKK